MLKQRVLITVAILSLGTAYGMAPKGMLSSDKPAQRSRRKAPKAITLGKINLPRQRQKKVRSIRRRRIVVHIRRSPARYVVPTIIVNRVNLKTRISQLRRGRTYISLDGNAIEKLGLQVIRDRRKGVQSVYLVKGDLVLHFTAKQATYQVNGKDHRIRGRSPYFYHGKLMVPFRSIAENLDLNIAWNNQSKEINVFV